MSLLVSFSIESRIISRKNDIFSFDFHLSSEKSKLYIHLSMTMAMALVMIHWPDMSVAHKITCNQSKLRSFSFSFFTSVKAIGSRTTPRLKTVCCQVNKEEQNLMLYGQFSAPVKRGISKEEGGGGEVEEKQNYYVNMGYAIRTLREDFPQLFYREPTFHVYRDDIVFKDPLNTFIGIENYKSIFWALRFYGRIFFKALWVDLISVWQPVENVIMVRWTVHGIPRVPWESRGRFDGTSEYKLDKKGKIFEHRVDNVAPNTPPKFRVLSMEELIQYIGCPSTPRPTCFEKTSSTDRT